MEAPHTYRASSIRRHLLGLSGLIFLAVGIYFVVWPPTDASSEFLQGSCTKAGLVLLAFWLAFPQLDRMPGWVVVSTVGGILLVAVRPQIVLTVIRLAVVLSPILGLIWLLRPQSWSHFRETLPGRILARLLQLASTEDPVRSSRRKSISNRDSNVQS